VLQRLHTDNDIENGLLDGESLEELELKKNASPNSGIFNVNIKGNPYRSERKATLQDRTPLSLGGEAASVSRQSRIVGRLSQLSCDSAVRRTSNFWKSKFDQLLLEKKNWTEKLK
jgi:hypothetical protein